MEISRSTRPFLRIPFHLGQKIKILWQYIVCLKTVDQENKKTFMQTLGIRSMFFSTLEKTIG